MRPAVRQALLGAYCPEARALFAAMTVQPTSDRKRTIDRTIRRLKSSGIWAKLDRLYVLRAHDAQAARIDWKTLNVATEQGTPGPSFTVDRGYTGDGSQSYLETNFNATAAGLQMSQNAGSLFAWSLTSGQQNADICGYRQASTGGAAFVIPRTTTDVFTSRFTGTGSLSNSGNTDGTGLYAVARNAASGANAVKAYKNGGLLGTTATTASTTLPNVTWRICGSGGTAAVFSACEVAIAGWGALLSDQEMADLYSILS